jgi:uncharacterized membrane protein YidH (DUF202 family)
MNKLQNEVAGAIQGAAVQKLGWWQTLFSILASVGGVQSWSHFERDTTRGSPRRYIVVLAGLLFAYVMLHVLVVHLVLRHAGLE